MSSWQAEARPIFVSIISHGQGAHVAALLHDLALPGNYELVRVLLTLNIPEDELELSGPWPYPFKIRRNPRPLGFAANHNASFRDVANAPVFCVLNPDVRLPAGALAELLKCFDASPRPALVAPAVVAPDGRKQESARPLPTPKTLVQRFLKLVFARHKLPVDTIDEWDWLAGMCMLFDAHSYRTAGGFDEGYFLYYEDVDICCRLRLSDGLLVYCPKITIVHDAQWGSHRHLVYLMHHVSSALRFFTSSTYSRYRNQKKRNNK